jgi:hypothetical protein
VGRCVEGLHSEVACGDDRLEAEVEDFGAPSKGGETCSDLILPVERLEREAPADKVSEDGLGPLIGVDHVE